MTTKPLAQRLREHVMSRGGPSKDASGNPVLPNGAWQMMLDAADHIESLERKLVQHD